MSDEIKFTYLSNIVSGIESFDISAFGGFRALNNAIAANCWKSHLLKKNSNVQKVGSLLKNSWRTEMASRWPFDVEDIGLQRVLASTLPVHAYYAIFNSARALAISEGKDTWGHREIHNDYRNVRILNTIGSWRYSCHGDTRKRDSLRVNPGSLEIPKHLSALSTQLSPEDYLLQALLTTRNWHLKHQIETYKRSQRIKTLSGKKREQFLAKNSASSILDFLYQLRQRSNYEENNEYGAEVEDGSINRFYSGVTHIVHSGLMHYETMIASRIGIDTYRSILEEWNASFRLNEIVATSQPMKRFLALDEYLKGSL